jgi:hypothetical protein
MRTEKELLQVLLDNMDKFETGLCIVTSILYSEGIITRYEKNVMHNYIYQYKPINSGAYYYWKIGKKQPRIDWLNEQINKL